RLYKQYSLELDFPDVKKIQVCWRKISSENLDLDYTILFPRHIADTLLKIFEDELQYFTGDLAKVKVFGKWHDLPRKQVTYGDPGLTYKYSGIVTPALPWPQPMDAVRNLISRVTGHHYNFVLVNRYGNGQNKMGEHKDDERELDPNTPIASVSLGQPRSFYFKHQDTRKPGPNKRNISKVEMTLEHGSLLLMNAPTNNYWYHALPPRKAANNVRINLTFRKIKKPT
ncbi:unnamed protein product, partial [Meganyctiphanes norvegica]